MASYLRVNREPKIKKFALNYAKANNQIKITRLHLIKFNQAGFTLVELIISIALTTVITTAVLLLFINSISINAETKKKQIALAAAESKVEEYRSKTFAEILEDQPVTPEISAENFVVNLPSGSGKVYILDYGTEDNLKEVNIEIGWLGAKSKSKNLILSTIIAESGINN